VNTDKLPSNRHLNEYALLAYNWQYGRLTPLGVQEDFMDVTAALITVAVTVGSLAPMSPNEQGPVGALPASAASIAGLGAVEPTATGADETNQLPSLRRASRVPPPTARPTGLVPLYASLAVLQGLDIFTTSKSLTRGGQEANPLMRPVTGKAIASTAVKAAATAGSIYFIERAWKQNRKGAVILMSAINVATAAVVAHNTQVAKQR